MPNPVPLARIVRSGVVESVHLGSVVVVDPEGRQLVSAGDADRPTFLRSTAKPLQAAASLHRAGLRLSDEEVAVMAASHNADPPHLEAVWSILERAGLSEEALGCPPGRPLDPDPSRAVEPPARILHNCSGKHAGMLLACVRRGDDRSGYLDPGHPLQREIRGLIEHAAGGPYQAEGIDGCGAPVGVLPLRGLATAFARLATPAALGEHGDAAATVVAAMRAAPSLVAGRGRVCTALMQCGDAVVAKVGAEGVAAAVLVDRELGVAVRVEDGASRARDAALVHALGLLDAVEPADRRLRSFHRPAVLGGGRPVGGLEPVFELS